MDLGNGPTFQTFSLYEICNPLSVKNCTILHNLHLKFVRNFEKCDYVYITTIYWIFLRIRIMNPKITALITAGGSLFLFLITTQHSNIKYILDLLKNLLFLVSNRLHFLRDLFLSFKCMLHNSKNLFIFLLGVSI